MFKLNLLCWLGYANRGYNRLKHSLNPLGSLFVPFAFGLKNQSCQVIPLVSCNKNITCHKKLLKFSGCDTEIELILARSACFRTLVNIQEMTIYPRHCEYLGIGWRRSIRQCSVPEELSGRNSTAKQKPEQGWMLFQSKLILEATEKFVPFGSGKQMFYVFMSYFPSQLLCWFKKVRSKFDHLHFKDT